MHDELYWEAVRTGERDDEDPHAMSALNFADELSADLWAWLNSADGVKEEGK